MNVEKRLELRRIAVELYGLHESAKSWGEPFVAYLVDMARIEAERLSMLEDRCADGPSLPCAEQRDDSP